MTRIKFDFPFESGAYIFIASCAIGLAVGLFGLPFIIIPFNLLFIMSGMGNLKLDDPYFISSMSAMLGSFYPLFLYRKRNNKNPDSGFIGIAWEILKATFMFILFWLLLFLFYFLIAKLGISPSGE